MLPRAATRDEQEKWQAFAQQWGAANKIIWDDQVPPAETPIWLLGSKNRQLTGFTLSLSAQPLRMGTQSVEIAGRELDLATHTVVIAGRAGSQPWMWTANVSGTDGLARRLQHYGKYSYLVFSGGRPTLRGQWTVQNSALHRRLD